MNCTLLMVAVGLEPRVELKKNPDQRPTSPAFFRTYDIRGRYPSEIDATVGRTLGHLFGVLFPGDTVIGRDPRTASALLQRSLTTGLERAGCTVRSIGKVPTAAVAFCARHYSAYGLAVTPSHNALGYVGLKAFRPTGESFAQEWQRMRRSYHSPEVESRANRPAVHSPGGRRLRSFSERGWQEAYLHHLIGRMRTSLQVVVEPRGGSTAHFAPRALRRMGARVRVLHPGFSATFHGLSPEPTTNNVAQLGQEVLRRGSDFGVTFDADGDRAVFVDSEGSPISPEAIGMILYQGLSRKQKPLVATVDASRRCEEHAAVVRSRVGGRFVHDAMLRSGADVGFEASGHFYLSRFGPGSDGILVACLVANCLTATGRSLAQFSNAFGPIDRDQVTLDFRTDREADDAYRRLRNLSFARVPPSIDGVTFRFPEGWWLIRRSQTQPAVRCTLEAKRGASLTSLQTRFRRTLERMRVRKAGTGYRFPRAPAK